MASKSTQEGGDILIQLESIYHRKILKAELVPLGWLGRLFGQARLEFFFSALPELVKINEKPEDASYPKIWFGRDELNEDIILDVENSHGVLVLSRAGGGKSIFARSIIEQFPNHEKIIIDDKGTDYLDLKINNYFNPTDIEELEQAVFKTEEHLNALQNFKLKLKKDGIQVPHWNKLTCSKPKPLLIICDEFAQYFTLDKKSTDKKREDLKQRLLDSIKLILSLYRVSGTVVICLTQDSKQSSTDLPFVNFGIKLFSKQNKQMSFDLIGSSKLNDDELIEGLFYLISPKFSGKIRTPYHSLSESLKQ